MSAGLDQAQIRRAFGRAAASYEAHAVLQTEVATRLRERLEDNETFAPARVLDVGCGPGRGTAALRARYPDAEVIALDLALPMLQGAAHALKLLVGAPEGAIASGDQGIAPSGAPATASLVCADAQALPLADASIDLVYSNLCLQWCEDPGLALDEFRARAATRRHVAVQHVRPGHAARTAQRVCERRCGAARQPLRRHARHRRRVAHDRLSRSGARTRRLHPDLHGRAHADARVARDRRDQRRCETLRAR